MRKVSTRKSCQSQSLSSTRVQNVHIKPMIGIRHKSFLRFCCGNCKKGFYSQAHLTYHLSKCFDVLKNFECIKCGMKFATEKELRFHLKSVHVDPEKGEKYYCDTCIVILFMHHCQSQEHRRKVAEMSH